MKLKILSYLSAQRKALGPAPPDTDVFTIIDPAALPGQAGEFHMLASLHRAWRDGVAEYDVVGFENAAYPFFIDPMQRRRLAVHFPLLHALREQSLQFRTAAEIAVSPAIFAAYEQARAAFDDADGERLRRWAGRIDMLAPPAAMPDPLRARHTDPAWESFTGTLRKFPAFTAAPDAVFNLTAWPRRNSFILRAELFMEFAGILFEALAETRNGNPRFPEFMAERLLGAFLVAKLHGNPLLAAAELALLRAVPPHPPTEPPAGFNPAAYALINLDLEPGTPAREHYLSHGWREGREWDLP